MKLDLALLADYAVAHADGRLYITGGGFTRIVAEQIPHVQPQLSFVIRVAFEIEEAGKASVLEVAVVGPSGQPLLTPIRWEVGWSEMPNELHWVPVLHASFSGQQILFPEEGIYTFRVSVNDFRIGDVPLEVISRQHLESQAAAT